MITILVIAVLAFAVVIYLFYRSRIDLKKLETQLLLQKSTNKALISRLKDADKWLIAANAKVNQLAQYQDIKDAEYAAFRIVTRAKKEAQDSKEYCIAMWKVLQDESYESINELNSLAENLYKKSLLDEVSFKNITKRTTQVREKISKQCSRLNIEYRQLSMAE